MDEQSHSMLHEQLCSRTDSWASRRAIALEHGWRVGAITLEKGTWERELSGHVQMDIVGVGNEWSGSNTHSWGGKDAVEVGGQHYCCVTVVVLSKSMFSPRCCEAAWGEDKGEGEDVSTTTRRRSWCHRHVVSIDTCTHTC